jgi:hypothetical protein
MSSKKAKVTVSGSDAAAQRKELARDLVKFRVSLDPSTIQSGKGPVQLRRELRVLNRVAVANKKK